MILHRVGRAIAATRTVKHYAETSLPAFVQARRRVAVAALIFRLFSHVCRGCGFVYSLDFCFVFFSTPVRRATPRDSSAREVWGSEGGGVTNTPPPFQTVLRSIAASQDNSLCHSFGRALRENHEWIAASAWGVYDPVLPKYIRIQVERADLVLLRACSVAGIAVAVGGRRKRWMFARRCSGSRCSG